MEEKQTREGIFEEGNLRIPFQIVKSRRRTMAVQVKNDGQVVVRIPLRMAWREAERFLGSHGRWVAEHYVKARESYVPPRAYTDRETAEGKQAARKILTARACFFAERMGVDFGSVSVRQQRTRWGSCSARGNLSFNWKLVLMPQEILDYVVVHELAHRREMNHSPRFWAVVAAQLPDYGRRRAWLKTHGGEY